MLTAGLLACSLSLGVVAPAQAAPKPAPAATAEGSSLEDTLSGLSSDTNTTKKTTKKSTKKTTSKNPEDFEALSGKVGLNGLQEWYDGSNDLGKTVLKVLGVIAAMEVIGMLLGPIRSFLFNVAGVR